MVMDDIFPISPITLGTVQLGFRYGVANRVGQPDVDSSRRMLAKALACGVSTWDTARHYGTAEEVIGDFIRSAYLESMPLVVTKFKWEGSALTDKVEALQQARNRVTASLRHLGIARLPILLFHQDKDQPIREVLRQLPDVLRTLKEDGLIMHGGISLYFAHDAEYVVDEPTIQAIQVPLNVLDQRLIATGVLHDFYRERKAVFIRSVFLQGLFFMEVQQLPPTLSGIIPYLKQLGELAREADMSMAQFAFSYVRDTVGVTSVIFGAETEEQVAQNALLLHGPSIPEAIRAKVGTLFRHLPEQLITPGYW